MMFSLVWYFFGAFCVTEFIKDGFERGLLVITLISGCAALLYLAMNVP